METWSTSKEFQQKYSELLSMSFEEANKLSLKEAETLAYVKESWDTDMEDD
ncbi:hypothetical protein [Enterococcus sp. BWR-S5]|uniref:hypothetical protein n=1 Tax=Enterococcus sp. BWR-S5 TaxID=2787714 RepID=UPI001923CCA4|nr:hypothetical protein [Enterococcus sp. BWR-S5]MBL1223680.1 hypothetical protein [Enterococcus sp. BWR-S5]